MIYILFSILLGAFGCILLVVPSSYYFQMSVFPIVGLAIMFFFRKTIPKPSKYILISLPFVMLLSYLLTSFLSFKPHNINLVDANKLKLRNDKTAIIFYSNGEMEKYIPYFAGNLSDDSSYLKKPIESYKVKKLYESINVSSKNQYIKNISREVQESTLKNKPYLFYNAYDGYSPNLRESINSSLLDGCKNIKIIDFSNDLNSSKELKSEAEALKDVYGINISYTKHILHNLDKDILTKKLPKDLTSFDGIILLDNNPDISPFKDNLKSLGIDDNKLYVGHDIESLIELSNKNNAKKVLIINTIDFEESLYTKAYIPSIIKKYDNINFTVISPIEYSKEFLNSIINSFKEI